MFGALQLGLGLTRHQGSGLPWYPNRLFQSGDILLWYDPSDLTTMFTNTTGTTQVAADGDSVALMLDKGQWGGKTLAEVLAAQPELVSNTGGPYVNTTGWVAGFSLVDGTISVSSGLLVMTRGASDGASSRFVLPMPGLTIGRLYEVVAGAVGGTGSFAALSISGNSAGTGALVTLTSAGSRFFVATATTMYAVLGHSGSVGQTATLASASVKEVPGYHRIQATGTSMPKYKTGPNPAAAEPMPDLKGIGVIDITGTATAATYNTSTGEGAVSRVDLSNQSFVTFSPLDDTIYHAIYVTCLTGTILVRVGTFSGTGLYTLPAGASILVPMTLTNRISITHTTAVGTSTFVVNSLKEIPASAPYIHWLLYDGSDDGNSTGTITWGTDEVAICAGVTKSSDAAAGAFAEFSANSSSNNGSFALLAPSAAASNLFWRSKGTAAADNTPTGFSAPFTGVLTGTGKIASDTSTLRANGAVSATSATDQGTGNFGSYAMYFGRRGGTTLPFNGREYQTVIRSRLLSAAELSSLETFVAEKTGVIL